MAFGINKNGEEEKHFEFEVSRLSAFILVFSTIALTAFEFFFRASYLFTPLFIYVLILFYKAKKQFKKKYVLFVIPIILISVIQCYNFGVSYILILGLLQKFFIYYAIASLLGERYFPIFVKIMYAFCLISLLFYVIQFNEPSKNLIIQTISPYTKALNKEVTEFNRGDNIIIHNFMVQNVDENRNSGPFWEPGMFSLFINLTFIFNYLIRKELINKTNIILLITNATTLSTAGIIAMALVIMGILMIGLKSKFRFIYLLLFLLCSFYISKMDFIKNKILFQYENATIDEVNRFGALLVHVKIITDYPIWGVGVGADANFFSKYTYAHALANGITNVFINYGLPLGIIYFILLYIALKRIVNFYIQNNIFVFFVFLSILILAFSQDITTRPLFYLLIVFGLFFMHREIENENQIEYDNNEAV